MAEGNFIEMRTCSRAVLWVIRVASRVCRKERAWGREKRLMGRERCGRCIVHRLLFVGSEPHPDWAEAHETVVTPLLPGPCCCPRYTLLHQLISACSLAQSCLVCVVHAHFYYPKSGFLVNWNSEHKSHHWFKGSKPLTALDIQRISI